MSLAPVALLVLFGLVGAPAQAADCTAPIRPASVMAIEPCDDATRIVEKAARVVPRPAQVAWQRREITAFTHFGMNTFTNREWGSGAEDEATFDPPGVDVEQWMRAYKAAGAELAMLTVKHHDGFVLYPTRYSNHSVIASPWWIDAEGCDEAADAAAARERAARARSTDASAFWQVRDAGCENAGGDLLGSYVRAARAAGLRVGVYLSPSDGAELPHAWHAGYVETIRAKAAAGERLSIVERATLEDGDRSPAGMGRFGSGSAVTPRTIPTLVEDDDRADDVAAGRLPSFQVPADDYNAYYLNQVYELLTEYGTIDELWLDGANPWSPAGITEPYDFTAWFELIEALSPETVVFGGPQGIRWVGNEAGVARETEWSVTPATADPDTFHGEWLLPEGAEAPDIGSRAKLTAPSVRFLQWFPAEADVSLRPGWFFHPDQRPKTPAQLVSLHERSVGRNASLLLNVPPDPTGRVAEDDVASLTSFGDAVRRTYARNLLEPARGIARALADDRFETAWRPRGERGSLTVRLPGRRAFDRIQLGEDITRGQRVEAFAVDIRDGSGWRQVGAATTIGYSRILTLAEPVTADRIRVRLLQARATPRLTTLGLYRSVAPG